MKARKHYGEIGGLHNNHVSKIENSKKNKFQKEDYFFITIPGSRNIIFGLIWILLGIGIILFLLEVSVDGQSIILPVIMVIFGIVQLMKGAGQFFSHSESEDEWT